jgi:hypothetical protein
LRARDLGGYGARAQKEAADNIHFAAGTYVKPDSHKTLSEYLTGVDLPSKSQKVRRGKQCATHIWRWMTDIPICDGDDALKINWLELVIKGAKGQIAYRNSFVTDLPVNTDNVAGLANVGRARWKIENETFNVLKTKGNNLEHNFGHGQNDLCVLAIHPPGFRSRSRSVGSPARNWS